MAATWNFWINLSFLTCFIQFSVCLSTFDRILGDSLSCTDVCKQTYSLHTSDQVSDMEACRRGCRLYSIIEFAADNLEEANTTKAKCILSCQEAYYNSSESEACIMGCNNELPHAVEQAKEAGDTTPAIHLLYPVMVVQGFYSNMISKLSHHMSITWSFYMQADDGKVVVIQTVPEEFTIYENSLEMEEDNDEYKTSNYLETNLEAVDNSATPDLKRSSLDLNNYESVDSIDDFQGSSDWLACVSKKTGLPRLFLSFTIFISAVMMIWLCLSSAATAPEHRVRAQKLSLYGDAEMIEEVKKNSLLIHLPQEQVSFGPLPDKITVEKV